MSFEACAHRLVGLLVEVQELEGKVVWYRELAINRFALSGQCVVSTRGLQTEIALLEEFVPPVSGHFESLQDTPTNTVLFALYEAEVLCVEDSSEIRNITVDMDLGGRYDTSQHPYVFRGLSERQQELIRAAITLVLQKKRTSLSKSLLLLKDSLRGELDLFEEAQDLEQKIGFLEKEIQRLACSLNKDEEVIWLERFDVPYTHCLRDYTRLVLLRLDLYNGLAVSFEKQYVLGCDMLPCTVGGCSSLVYSDFFSTVVGPMFDIRSAVLFRPPAEEHKVVLCGQREEGMLDEFGVFVRV